MNTSARPHILLVEDNDIAQMMIVELFKNFDSDVDVAETGMKGVSEFAKNTYDFVLMDIGLPDIDGCEATKLIRATEKGKSVPVIAVTAHAVDQVQAQCDAVGMNEIIAKPLLREKAQELLKHYFH